MLHSIKCQLTFSLDKSLLLQSFNKDKSLPFLSKDMSASLETNTATKMGARRDDVSLRGRFNSHQGMTFSHMVLMEHSLGRRYLKEQ